MDVEAMVERMQLLAERRDFAALAALCASPEIVTIAQVAACARWGLTDGAVQRLAAHPLRNCSERTLAETEIDVETVGHLATAGVLTLGHLAALTDDELLEVRNVTPERLRLIRAVEAKYRYEAAKRAEWLAAEQQRRKQRRCSELIAALHEEIGLRPSEIGEVLGLGPRAVAKALKDLTLRSA